MVAITNLIPQNPRENATVREVFREHPELPGYIARATEHAREVFTDPEFHLDPVRYEEDDPLLNLIIRVPMPWPEFEPAFDTYLHWLHAQPEHDEELLLIFPQLADPIGSRS
jgi:hypothetical protein